MQVHLPTEQSSKLPAVGLFLTGLGAAIALLYFGRTLCITLVISVILAFILDPVAGAFVHIRLPRAAGALFACTLAIFMLYLAGLGLFSQLTTLTEELPVYSQRINELVDDVAERLERTEQNAYRLLVPKRFQDPARLQAEQSAPAKRRRRNDPPPPPAVQEVRIREDRSSILNFLYGYVSSVYNALLMSSFVPFLVYFMLSWRDQMRRRFLLLFDGEDRLVAGKAWESIAEMARAYVVGNFILGLLLSVVSCAVFWSWQLPYWILVGFISGFLSLVPYVGLPLALVAPMCAALMTYDTITPYLIIAAIVALLHLLALNLLYPALVGARVHLNPLTVTVALMFWGTLWGAIGLVLAIPITAGAKAVFDNIDGLKPWGQLLGD